MKHDPFEYSATVPLPGGRQDVLADARAMLLAAGFRAAGANPGSATFLSPGLNSTRQNPLLGASRLRVAARGGRLSVDAELGGARRLGRFARFFPPLLCGSLAVLFTVVFSLQFDSLIWMPAVYGTTGLLAGVWLLVGPVLQRTIRRSTQTALDNFVAALSR